MTGTRDTSPVAHLGPVHVVLTEETVEPLDSTTLQVLRALNEGRVNSRQTTTGHRDLSSSSNQSIPTTRLVRRLWFSSKVVTSQGEGERPLTSLVRTNACLDPSEWFPTLHQLVSRTNLCNPIPDELRTLVTQLKSHLHLAGNVDGGAFRVSPEHSIVRMATVVFGHHCRVAVSMDNYPQGQQRAGDKGDSIALETRVQQRAGDKGDSITLETRGDGRVTASLYVRMPLMSEEEHQALHQITVSREGWSGSSLRLAAANVDPASIAPEYREKLSVVICSARGHSRRQAITHLKLHFMQWIAAHCTGKEPATESPQATEKEATKF
eukprot:CAMPEP_0176460612 /NCGR_PEP_ID=MMETSP0127-20121128/34088_1 /TAXON_ID=938130 /ORGANISM="Platyophrya macrostoma, Strain WH" /LENGTH=323 /DNA_ID=CAMNT_0017851997 /DNA_START=62 /DNA_END=1033 /DNA_ORIENTATION=-